jgi:catechol 2,3-dioxygenase-like lactoylglutathione lyase family enzyme
MDLMLIDHIGLNVRNLSVSLEFYSRVFGFSVLHRWETTWMIQKGDLKIGLFQRPDRVTSMRSRSEGSD